MWGCRCEEEGEGEGRGHEREAARFVLLLSLSLVDGLAYFHFRKRLSVYQYCTWLRLNTALSVSVEDGDNGSQTSYQALLLLLLCCWVLPLSSSGGWGRPQGFSANLQSSSQKRCFGAPCIVCRMKTISERAYYVARRSSTIMFCSAEDYILVVYSCIAVHQQHGGLRASQ